MKLCCNFGIVRSMVEKTLIRRQSTSRDLKQSLITLEVLKDHPSLTDVNDHKI